MQRDVSDAMRAYLIQFILSETKYQYSLHYNLHHDTIYFYVHIIPSKRRSSRQVILRQMPTYILRLWGLLWSIPYKCAFINISLNFGSTFNVRKNPNTEITALITIEVWLSERSMIKL